MVNEKKKRKRNVELLKLVGSNIRKFRKLKGLSIAQLAFDCGIEPRIINNYELGKVDPNLTMLYIVCQNLGVHPGQLFDV